jgi:hypothetical protein
MSPKTANPYKQQRVTLVEEKPKKVSGEKEWPRPAFNEGDLVTTVFKPLQYNIPRPTRVIEVKQNKLCIEGWALVVETDKGPRELSHTHFSKYKPAPERSA